MNSCLVINIEGKKVAKETNNSNLYIVNWKLINKMEVGASPKFLSNEDNVDIWHQRPRYLNVKCIKELQSIVSGLYLSDSTTNYSFKK